VPTEDIELEGKVLQKGSRVQLGIGAANHDLTEFSNPEQLDFTPPKVNSLAFGYGPHFCLGAALARMDVQIALSRLLRRMPRVQLERKKFEYRRFISCEHRSLYPSLFRALNWRALEVAEEVRF
jgi:cytochrome P450